MFCAYCGTKLEDDAKFCYNCGNSVDTSGDSEQETAANPTVDGEVHTTTEENQQQEGAPVEAPAEVPDVAPVQSVEEAPAEVPDMAPVQSAEEAPVEVPNMAPVQPAEEASAEVPDMAPVQLAEEAPEHIPGQAPVQPTEEAPEHIPGQGAAQPTNTATAQPVQDEQQNLTGNAPKKKKSKKGLVIGIIAGVIVLAAGGAFAYSKITLNHLDDSVETFKTMLADKGLDQVAEYTDLVTEGEDIVSGFKVFKAKDMESRLDQATLDCEELSKDLIELMEQKNAYDNLSATLIMDSADNDSIQKGKDAFDQAIKEGNKKAAKEALSTLEQAKHDIAVKNRESLTTDLDTIKYYDNEDFTDEDHNTIDSAVTQIETLMDADDYVKAQSSITALHDQINTIEVRIAQDKEAAALAEIYAKPEKLVVMLQSSIFDDDNYRGEFERALEDKLGIDIVFEQYKTPDYYDAVQSVFAYGSMPDVILLNNSMYTEYASLGLITDITQYWEESDTAKNPKFKGSETFNNLKIDGKLYGFTPVRENGCVTYVRKSWMDKLNIAVPTNYQEFTAMLQAFTENNMDALDPKRSTYGMTAAGYMDTLDPYVTYLQEFYQDAYPDFYKNASGQWVDGFSEQAMIDALTRMQEAKKLGIIDPDMAANTANQAAAKFAAGDCGVISMLEGQGAEMLQAMLASNGQDTDLVVLPPIAEVGKYITRRPPVFAITTSCKSPAGVVKYFFEPMLDGKDVEMLWTYGVQGVHWDTKAEAVDFGYMTNQYQEGEFHSLNYPSAYGFCYNYNYIDPLRSLRDFDNGIDNANFTEKAVESVQMLNMQGKLAPEMKYSDSLEYYRDDIADMRKEIIDAVMIDGEDPATAMEEYKYYTEDIVNDILTQLNQ